MTAPDDLCQRVREDAAVAVLRREPFPDDVREHLAGCAACAADVDRLAVLGPLLDASRDDDVPAAERPGESLLRRLLGELARRRRRRRVLVVAAAAVASVLLALPLGMWLESRTGVADGTLVAAGQVHDDATAAGATVQVLAHGEGRGSVLVVAPYGLPGGVNCRIELVDSSGEPRTVTQWRVPEGYTEGWTARREVSVAPREIADVRLVDADTGKVLLEVPVAEA